MRKPKHKKPRLIGIGWYRPEQWERLREISVDVEDLEETHAEWLSIADKTYSNFENLGVVPVRVDVDVEELLVWCHEQGLPVDAKARAQFTTRKMRPTWDATRTAG